MRRMELPAFDVRTTYTTCISIARPAAKSRLKNLEDAVVKAGEEYETAAKNHTLHDLTDIAARPSDLTDRKQLKKVYTDRMAKKGTPGHEIYNAIKNAAEDLCPLCGIGKVETLDHQLPKGSYPLLAVVPANLVPACRDCNTGKADASPAAADAQALHPYFDEFSGTPWLAARLVRKTATTPMTARFFVDAPSAWDPAFVARLQAHLDLFNLSERYALQVGSHLSTLSFMFAALPGGSDEDGVGRLLASHAEGWTHTNPNSWESALYRALAADSWYIGGGWRQATGLQPAAVAPEEPDLMTDQLPV
ncbi:HNH endonuclease [Streptomyces sp. NPDC085932]|uniref:HNH endonuclease n=1 Tax=Streptomyces sp. NPDC085932 TaxID=3365741 RepID=UPI0037D65199